MISFTSCVALIPKLNSNARPQEPYSPCHPLAAKLENRNIEIGADFVIWNHRAKLGVLFDSSTAFRLPDGGDRAPDLSWVLQARWDALSPEEREKFPPISPDFVLELMSPSDAVLEAQAKMDDYLRIGVRLGWLISRKQRRVWIYRPHAEVQALNDPVS